MEGGFGDEMETVSLNNVKDTTTKLIYATTT
jgi:hypothetical protein